MGLSLDYASVYVFVFRLLRQYMCLSLDCASVYMIVFRLCVSVCDYVVILPLQRMFLLKGLHLQNGVVAV